VSSYLVTHEDIEDGIWFEEPNMFDSEAEARAWVGAQPAPAMGSCRVLYRCDHVTTLAETPIAVSAGKLGTDG